jgi:hypothetical protein
MSISFLQNILKLSFVYIVSLKYKTLLPSLSIPNKTQLGLKNRSKLCELPENKTKLGSKPKKNDESSLCIADSKTA